MKVAFILHGKLKRLAQLKEKLAQAMPSGFTAEFYPTQHPHHATELTTQALFNGAAYAIAVGGDGLLNEVANGYMLCSDAIKKQAAIGVIPQGTGNDFCKTIGIKKDRYIQQLHDLLTANSIKITDACYMKFLDVYHQPTERYYINIADIGIGGYASQRVNRSSKILGSTLCYVKAIILTFLDYKH